MLIWLKRRVGSVVVTLLLVSTVLWLLGDWSLEESQPVAKAKTPEAIGLSVSVIEAIPVDTRIKVDANGITVSRWSTEITASVSGRVVEVANNTLPGRLVKKGEVLVSLLDTFYQSEMEAARAKVAQAELDLSETLNRQQVAKISNSEKLAFGRFEPHVKAAKTNLEAAKAALASAEQQLANTHIKAPFDAVVIADLVHPGKWVNAGEVLFRIAASAFLDVNVELAEVNWQRLYGIQQRADTITVVAENGSRWPASIRYLSPVMDSVTRQRSMMLQVANPFQHSESLLADQHVSIIFEGEPRSSVVNAPASVLTEDGQVWSVVDNVLRLETIELLNEQPEFVMFRYLDRPEQKRLLVRFPLSSYLDGQPVTTTVL